MRQFAHPAWLIAAALLASGQAPGPAAVPSPTAASPASEAPPDGGTVLPTPRSPEDASDAAAPSGDGTSLVAPAPPASSAAPREPIRHRMGAAEHVGHFRVYEHPSCARDPCQARVGDLDSGRSFEAMVSLGPMHLARQLEEFARSGQIELLLSGELRRGPVGPTLRALHLEGVTPHAAGSPPAPHVRHATPGSGAERSRLPVAPPRRLLRA